MAAASIPLSSVLAALYETGETAPGGGPVIRKKSVNYVKPDAAVQDLFDVITALYSISQKPLNDVRLQKNYRLVDEE